ncbi:GlpM family protein [Sulfurospirillum sp. 1612]|uniref:GlpM family protein n=1 Tax=Sulfurospirillum sp. 1612 TaxID=3094835 RepID=UPI002F95DC4E
MDLALKALLGAITVIIIQLFAQSKSFFIAGLAPLFPTFALIAHYIVGSQRGSADLKETILFGIFSLIPYFFYMISLYFFVDRWSLGVALIAATIVWLIAATILVLIWLK